MTYKCRTCGTNDPNKYAMCNHPVCPDGRDRNKKAVLHDDLSEHLGDGCYVSFDGFQVWFAANHHENKVVALEPSVLIAFARWIKRVPHLKEFFLRELLK